MNYTADSNYKGRYKYSCSLLSGLPQGQGENGGRGGLYINTPYGQVLTSCSWQCTCGLETACLCQLTGNNLPLSADWKPFAHISWLETVCPNQLSVKAGRLYQLTGNGLSLSADDKQKPIYSLFWADRKQLASVSWLEIACPNPWPDTACPNSWPETACPNSWPETACLCQLTYLFPKGLVQAFSTRWFTLSLFGITLFLFWAQTCDFHSPVDNQTASVYTIKLPQ